MPIVLGALVLTPRLLPSASGESSVGSFDSPGVPAVVLGITSVVYGFVEAGNKAWGSPNSYLFIAAGVVLLGIFVVIEEHTAHPLVRFSIFRSRSITGADLAMFAFYMAAIGVWFYLALYLQEVKGHSALKAGILVLPLNVTVIMTATLSSRWISRFGPKPVAAFGSLLLAGGLFWLHFMTVTGSYVHALSHGASTHEALDKGFADAILLATGFAVAALLISVFVLSNRENRAFVEMVKAGGDELEEAADAVAEAESMAALGGEGFESKMAAGEVGVGAGPTHQR